MFSSSVFGSSIIREPDYYNKTSLKFYILIVEKFKKEDKVNAMCRLLSPIKGFTVRTKIECATEGLEKSAFCEGFIFSSNTGLCKLVGNLGIISSKCNGEYYLLT